MSGEVLRVVYEGRKWLIWQGSNQVVARGWGNGRLELLTFFTGTTRVDSVVQMGESRIVASYKGNCLGSLDATVYYRDTRGLGMMLRVCLPDISTLPEAVFLGKAKDRDDPFYTLLPLVQVDEELQVHFGDGNGLWCAATEDGSYAVDLVMNEAALVRVWSGKTVEKAVGAPVKLEMDSNELLETLRLGRGHELVIEQVQRSLPFGL